MSPYLLAAATRAPFFTRTWSPKRKKTEFTPGVAGLWRANLAYSNVVPKGRVVERSVPMLVGYIRINAELEQLKGERGYRGFNPTIVQPPVHVCVCAFFCFHGEYFCIG